MKVWVVIPVFNEAAGIQSTLNDVYRELIDVAEFKLIVVDDGSTDSTLDLVNQSIRPQDIAIALKTNQGPGVAFQEGISSVLSQADPKDLLLTLEGDGTTDWSSLKSMIQSIQTHDLVLASVYLKGGGFSRTSWWRMALSKVANHLSNLILGIRVNTLTSFYRLWRIELLLNMQSTFPKLIQESGFICQVELLYKAHLCGARITEVPTHVYGNLRQGKSKMKLVKTALSHLKFLLSVRSIKSNARSKKF